jgi:hypothetical protein|tara:strand:- start:3133 stop:3504 length:372 start_codon:yes stop_codon:yes gene_type:complete
MGDKALRGNKLTRVGFKQGGAYGPLRGTTAGGVAKAFRGPSGFKESQALQKKILKNAVKKTQKMPDKKFKHVNLETRKHLNPRTGRIQDVQKTELVKGSVGKKNYIQQMKRYHHAKQPKKGKK